MAPYQIKLHAMEQILTDLLKGQALPLVMTVIALSWMQRMNQSLVEKLNEERNNHLKSLGDQIKGLEDAILECERDRKELWQRILNK